MAIRRQIERYRLYSARKTGNDRDYLLGIGLGTEGGNYDFIKYLDDGIPLPGNSHNTSNNRVTIYKHFKQAAVDIDILRNESPVFLFYWSPTLAYINTGAEDVGEGELPG